MRTGSAFTIFGLIALQGVAATSWRDQDSYSCPQNIKNDCTKDESNGFDWSDLPTGSFDRYKDYNFKGWSCTQKLGKRNLEGRTFNSKCIEADVRRDNFSNEISCEKSFSIGEIDVSVDDDTDVEFHYGMPDGSTCKKVSKCKKDGNTVQNDQCGGARTVKVKLPNNSDRTACKLGFHKVKFECGTTTTSVPVPTTTIPSCAGPNCCNGKPCTTLSACVTGKNCSASTTTSASCTGKGCPPCSGKNCPSTTSAPVSSSTTSGSCSGKDCPSTTSTACVPGQGKGCPGTTSAPASSTSSAPCTGKNCSGNATAPGASTSCVPGVGGKRCPPSTLIVPSGSAGVPCTGLNCTGTATAPGTTSAPGTSTICVPGKGGKGCPPSTVVVPPGSTSIPCNGANCSGTTTIAPGAPSNSTSAPCNGKGCPGTTSASGVPTSCAPGMSGKGCPPSTVVVPPGSTSVPCNGANCSGTTTIAPVQSSNSTSTVPCKGKGCPGTTYAPGVPTSCVPGMGGKGCPSSTAIVPSGKNSSIPTGSGYSTFLPVASSGSVTGSVSVPTGSSTIKGAASVSSSHPAVTTTATPLPPTECPPTLPRCLKTWIFITSCTDTANPSCFCPHTEFIIQVSECVQSWGKDDADVSKSLEYLLGICQPYIPVNPAIVTCLPPTITLPPPPPNVPATTIVQTITTVVPCPLTTVAKGSASGSVISVTTTTLVKTITIPKVTLVVTATDATLVYPTALAAPTTATRPPTGPGSATNVPAGPTTLVKSPIAPSTVAGVPKSGTVTATGTPKNGTVTVTGTPKNGTITVTGIPKNGTAPTNIIVSPGAASGLFPTTFAAAVGVILVVAFQF